MSFRILIACPQSTVIDEVKIALADAGFTVQTHARSSDEALRVVTQIQPDIVLLSLNITGDIDPIVAGDFIRDEYRTPVVLIANDTDDDDAGSLVMLRTTSKDFATVPTTPGGIIQSIKETMGQHEAEPEPISTSYDWQLVVDYATDAIRVIDEAGYLVAWNPANERISGITRREALGKHFRHVLTQELGDGQTALFRDLRETIDGALETGYIASDRRKVEYEVVRPDGSRRNVVATMFPIETDRGTMLGSILHDITQRKQFEAHAIETADQLKTLRKVDLELSRRLSLSYVMQITLDAVTRMSLCDVVYVGLLTHEGRLAIRHALGHHPPELIGTRDIVPGSIIHEVLETQQAKIARVGMMSVLPGDFLPGMQAQMVLPLVSGGRVIGVLAAQTKHQNRFTFTVFESLKTLAARIALAIDNSRTYEERDQLISELKAYAHTVAHDLKGPLVLLQGYSDILRDVRDMDDDTIEVSLDALSGAVTKMTGIIDSLLLLAKVRDGRDVAQTPLDMAEIVSDARLRFSRQAADAGAVITTPENWPRAKGFAPWVEEVWANYIGNALKYGGTPPHITLGADLLDDGKALFWVSDNGPGIPEGAIDSLFLPFTQFSTRKVDGEGLGLSIVRRIMDRLGGDVYVSSKPGEGATFGFILPLA